MKIYTTPQMIEFVTDIEPCLVEFAGNEGMLDAIAVRLKSHDNHIKMLQQRLDLAEKVIGELYLMQEETRR